MREQWARRIALLTGQLVLLLSIAFAVIQNPGETSDTTESRGQAPPLERLESITLDPERIEAGRQIYKRQSCARCHSIAGEGNSRNPLDDVSVKSTAEELRDWITGADALQGVLPAHVFRLKQRYSALPGDDLDALIIYMQSLRL
ncbi:MAG: cytochrome c [Candidatus Polarisedimenticolaceae bacterium]|nr:cytochrome c [Candidatus Polarisedimenticolaceae bacterium]